MTILLTNDDGFNAPGIKAMEDVLKNAGHQVWVCAPDRQRSACSHSITISGSVEIKEVSPRHFTCSGTPADCVLYFLRSGFNIPKFDVVISGINNGYNLSCDILYSGTVGAASEAVFFGLPAIAVSAHDDPDAPFEDAAVFTAKYLEKFVEICQEGSFINVNVPRGSNGNWKVSVPYMAEYYAHVVSEESKGVFTLSGDPGKDLIVNVDTDIYVAEQEHKIAVTAVQVIPAINTTMQERIGKLQ